MPSPALSPAAAYEAAHQAMLATWPVTPEVRWVETPFGRTHLLACGPEDAPPVFLVPGMATPGVAWSEQIPALVGAHRVYAVDMPGNVGRSEPARRPRRFADLARWFSEMLDALGIARADYVGMSYGGCVGAQLALAVPERLRRLVLMAPAATIQPLSAAFMLRTLPLLLLGTRAQNAGLMRWMALPPTEGRERYEHQVEAVIDLFYTGRRRQGLTILPNPPVLDDAALRRISVPTLVMIGEGEKIYDARAALDRARALIPGVSTALIPGASHDLMYSQPARVNAELAAFLGAA